MSSKLKNLFPGRRAVPPWPTRVVSLAAGMDLGQAGRRAGCLAGTVCLVFLFVLAPAAALAKDKTTWEKYNNAVPPDTSDTTNWGKGRIPLGKTNKGDDKFVVYQSVIKDGSTYKMWYSAYDESNWRIYYATSTDGLTWTKYSNNIPDASDSICTNGTIALGSAAGTGDEKHAKDPSVIKDDSFYKMWYTGMDAGSTSRIYYATSSNGLTWIKYTNAIPPDTSDTTNWGKGRIPLGTSGGDTASVSCPAVIKDGSTYKMWYGGSDGTNARTYHATSSDGLTWRKYTNAVPPDTSDTTNWGKGRIPLGTSGGDTNHAAYPTVIKVRSTYKMWYAGNGGAKWRIYYATSPDGLTWTKYTNAIPTPSNTTGTKGRIPLGTSGGDDLYICGPCVIKEGLYQEGYKYKMWYGGHDGFNWRIYHATCVQPPKAGTIFYGH